MKTVLKDRSFRLSILLTFVFLTLGFIFLHYGLNDYGWVLFVLLPVVLGVSIGALPSKRSAYAGLIISLLVFLFGLIALGLEGYICVIMTLPIVLP